MGISQPEAGVEGEDQGRLSWRSAGLCGPDVALLLPSELLVLALSHLDWNPHLRLSGSQAFKIYCCLSWVCFEHGRPWDFTTSVMASQYLVINLFLYFIHTLYISTIASVSLESPDNTVAWERTCPGTPLRPKPHKVPGTRRPSETFG